MTPTFPVAFDLPEGFCLLGPVATQKKAQEWLLVLNSVKLDGSVRWIPSAGWGILITEGQYRRAVDTLRTYEKENQDWPPKKVKDRPLYAKSWWAVGVMALLVAMFALTGPSSSKSVWFRVGTASADMILQGSAWQAVTALTLHADSVHVMGNAIIGGVFLAAVHQRLGAGLGTAVTVAAGTVGNLMNAVWYGSHHWSIGASTAVFGALGALAASQVIRNHDNEPRSRWGLWGPVAGGLVLLGLLGSGSARDAIGQVARNTTDVAAHGFGFVGGLIFGAIAAFVLRSRANPLPAKVQWAFGVGTMLTVVSAWVTGFLTTRPVILFRPDNYQ